MGGETKLTAPDGFVRVSRERFFATVGQMDVHPKPDERRLSARWHRSDWENRQRAIVGVSHKDSWTGEGEYFVRPSMAEGR